MEWLKQHAKQWYGTITICVAGGCIVATAIFFMGLLKGYPAYAAVGIAGGLGLAGLFIWLERRRSGLKLEKVKLKVPVVGEVEFLINAQYRHVAWQLFIESVTRVATQPLANDEGRDREALNSLYRLFEVTRDSLKDISPTPTTEGWTVELLGIQMLNHELRPFLSRWHFRLTQFENLELEGGTWPQRGEFRAELQELRKKMIQYVRGFADLAKVEQPQAFFLRSDIEI